MFALLNAITNVAVVAIVFWSVASIVRMSLRHAERMARIKHGYPLDDTTPRKEDYVDYTDSNRQQ